MTQDKRAAAVFMIAMPFVLVLFLSFAWVPLVVLGIIVLLAWIVLRVFSSELGIITLVGLGVLWLSNQLPPLSQIVQSLPFQLLLVLMACLALLITGFRVKSWLSKRSEPPPPWRPERGVRLR